MKELTPEQTAKWEARKKLRGEMVVAFKNVVQDETKPVVHHYFSVEGHEYSMKNQMYLAFQNCEFGKLGGFQQWRKMGRKVKKGEHGFDIMLPLKEKDENGKVLDEEKIKFLWTTLFHENQTEPMETKDTDPELTHALQAGALVD